MPYLFMRLRSWSLPMKFTAMLTLFMRRSAFSYLSLSRVLVRFLDSEAVSVCIHLWLRILSAS